MNSPSLVSIQERMRQRLAASDSLKTLAETARANEADFIKTRDDLWSSLNPGEYRKLHRQVLEESDSPMALQNLWRESSGLQQSHETDEATKRRAMILLRRAHAPYVASVIELLRGAAAEIAKALTEIEAAEDALFKRYGCEPQRTFLSFGTRQLLDRLNSATTGLSDPNLQPAKLTHWINYATGAVDAGTM